MKIHQAHTIRQFKPSDGFAATTARGIFWKLMSKTVITSDTTTIDFTDLKLDAQYMLRFQNAVATDNATQVGIRCDTDNGASFDASGIYTHYVDGSTTSTNQLIHNADSETNSIICDDAASSVWGNEAGEVQHGLIWFMGTGDTGRYKMTFRTMCVGNAATGLLCSTRHRGLYENTVPVNAVQLITAGASGFASGTFWFYEQSP
jgi:hypothetical protein